MAYHVRMSVRDEDAVLKRFDPPIANRMHAQLAIEDEIDASERVHFPRRLLVQDRMISEVPDFIGWSTGPFIVSARVRDCLEDLEPGAHDFHTIEVGTDKTPETGVPYNLIVCLQRVDAIVVEQTDFRSGFGRRGFEQDLAKNLASGAQLAPGGAVQLSERADAVWTVRAPAVKGKHLWRLPRQYRSKHLCSDVFRDRALAERYTGLEFVKRCPEV